MSRAAPQAPPARLRATDVGPTDVGPLRRLPRRRVDRVAFGKGGPHFCLGNQLAGLELRIMMEELVPRLPDALRAASPVVRVRSDFVHGMKIVPVAVEATDEEW